MFDGITLLLLVQMHIQNIKLHADEMLENMSPYLDIYLRPKFHQLLSNIKRFFTDIGVLGLLIALRYYD